MRMLTGGTSRGDQEGPKSINFKTEFQLLNVRNSCLVASEAHTLPLEVPSALEVANSSSAGNAYIETVSLFCLSPESLPVKTTKKSNSKQH